MEIFATTLGWIGAICIGIFSSPQLIRVLRTKDTYSVPLLMFCILTLGSFCFTLQGFCNIGMSPSKWDTYIGVTIANILSFVLAASVLTIKLVHMYTAKQLNMTEKDYCNKLLAQKKGKK